MICFLHCYIVVVVIMSTTNQCTNTSAIKTELTNLGLKSIRASYQLRYLLSTRNNGNIAKGIATQMKFTCSVKENDFMKSCSKLNVEHKSRMFDLVIENQRIRSKRSKAIFYCRKEHYRNNMDFI